MRAWILVAAASLAGCGPSLDEQFAALHARSEAAVKASHPHIPPEQQVSECIKAEVRAIVVRPIAADPNRAADVVMLDCQPRMDGITRDMPLTDLVHYNRAMHADIAAQIAAATR